MAIILVTSCSNRKAIPPEERLQASELPRAPIEVVGNIWHDWLRSHPHRMPAGLLYQGRGVVEARSAARTAGASHWFVSAGLGLVSADEEVPGYDLTVSGNCVNHIRKKIEDEVFDPQAWWKELSRHQKPHRTLARLVRRSNAHLVVLALPSNYLRMALGDISALSPADMQRLRIVGPPKNAIPEHLQPFWLPYDSRLDGAKSPIRGTRSDFPQRAARHFFEAIWSSTRKNDLESHIRGVKNALTKLPYPDIPRRKQLNDEEIIRVIKDLWARAEGKSGRMLRILRDEEQIACEQGRFKHLFNLVKHQFSTTL